MDHRTDIYSLGATYYSLLTGQHPFYQSDSVPQLMYQHCHGPIPDPRADNPQVPEACAHIIARAMAKAPDDRYQSTTEMLADLQAVLATMSGQTRITLPSESGRVPAANLGCHAHAKPWAWHPKPRFACHRRHRLPRRRRPGLIRWRPWQTADTAGAAAAGPTGEPVKVGVLHSLSGTMATSAASSLMPLCMPSTRSISLAVCSAGRSRRWWWTANRTGQHSPVSPNGSSQRSRCVRSLAAGPRPAARWSSRSSRPMTIC